MVKAKAPVQCEECAVIDLLEVVDTDDGLFEIITQGWYLCDDGESWICASCREVTNV